jgi:hypothetical protein
MSSLVDTVPAKPEEFVVVELQTHGVSGTPPESMLGTDSVVQVDTLEHTRFYQEGSVADPTVADPSQHPVMIGDTKHPRLREAYHWGGMTSGGFMQALWALLLPFSLVNLAQWMLPAPMGKFSAIAVTAARALTRVIGLLLTALIAAQFTVIVADLFFSQCLSSADPKLGEVACWSSESIAGHLPSWLERWTFAKALIADIPDELREHPLLSGIVIALIFTAAVVLCGTMTGAWYAKKLGFGQDRPVDGAAEVSARAQEAPAVIGSDEFRAKSTGSPTAPALRTLHTVAAFCSSALVLLGMWRFSGNNAESYLWSVAVVMAVFSLFFGLLLDDPTLSGGRYTRGHPLARKVLGGMAGWLISIAACLVFLAVCVLVVPARLDSSAFGTSMTGSNDAVSALMVALCGLCLVLLGFVAVPAFLQWRFQSSTIADAEGNSRQPVPRKFRAMLFGVHAPFLAALACIVGSGFGAGVAQIVAHFLVMDGVKARLPGIYQAVAFLWGIIALGLAALAFVALLFLAVRSLLKPYPDAKFVQFGAGATTLGLRQRVKFGGRWYLSRINQYLHRIVAYIVGFAVLGGMISIHTSEDLPMWLLSLRDATTGCVVEPMVDLALRWDRLANADWSARQGELEGAGFAILGLLAATLLRSIMNARKNPEKGGRSLGVIWDLACFWPREAHPVTPMSYAPTALDELVGRTYHYLGLDPTSRETDPTKVQDNRVVLCGHSQGSLLMYAAVLQVWRELTEDESPEPLKRLALLTYGSPLQWAFVRGFPSMLSFESNGLVMGTLEGRWHNLIRFTDFVGGPVLSWDRTLEGGEPLSSQVLVPSNGTAFYGVASSSTIAAGRVTLGREHWLADPEPDAEKMWGHSNYLGSLHWDSVVSELVSESASSDSSNDPGASSDGDSEAQGSGDEEPVGDR